MKLKVLALLSASASLGLIGAPEPTRIPKDITFQKLVVDSNTTNALLVHDNATVERDLTVVGDTTIGGDMAITGSITGDIAVTGDIEARDITATRDVMVGDDLTVTGTTTITSDLNANGIVTFARLTPAGVVHNNATGELSSSLIVNSDIDSLAGIVDTKLATISTAGKVLNSATTATSLNTANAIVARDSSGDFAANVITAATVDGLVQPVNGSEAANKTYVDFVAQGIRPLSAVSVVASGATADNFSLTGTCIIDGVTLAPNDRVLLNSQTNPVQNGVWLVQTGAWTRPADYSSASASPSNSSKGASVLVNLGTWNGSNWLSTATFFDLIDTDAVLFAQNASAQSITGNNPAGNPGAIFKDKVGNLLNLRSIRGGTNMDVSSPAAGDTTVSISLQSPLTSPLVAQAGSAGAPSIRFDVDNDSGIYHPSDGIIGVATDGVERLSVTNSETLIKNGFCTDSIERYLDGGTGPFEKYINPSTSVVIFNNTNYTVYFPLAVNPGHRIIFLYDDNGPFDKTFALWKYPGSAQAISFNGMRNSISLPIAQQPIGSAISTNWYSNAYEFIYYGNVWWPIGH